MNTSSSSGTSLRDTLTTIKESLPSKKRKFANVETGAYNYESDLNLGGGTTEEKGCKSNEETTTIQGRWRKSYINEMMPFLYPQRVKNGDHDDDISTAERTKQLGASTDQDYDNNDDYNEDGGDKKTQSSKLESKCKDKITNNEKKNYYLEQLNVLKKENEDITRHKKEIVDRFYTLVSTYEYGLDTVSKLNDLSSAPDNILKE